MFRFGWRTFVAINVIAYLPVALVNVASVYLTYGAVSDWQQTFLDRGLQGYGDVSQMWAAYPWEAVGITALAGLLVGVFAMVGQAAIVDATATAMRGERLSATASWRAALARLPGIIAIYIVLGAITLALALLGIGVPLLAVLPSLGITGGPVVFIGLVVFVAAIVAVAFMTIRFAFAVFVLIVERLPAIQALRRSWRILSGSMLRLIGWSLVFGLILGFIGFVIGFVGLIISFVIEPPRLATLGTFSMTTEVLQALLTSFAAAIFTPISAIGLTLLYFEIRWRHGEAVPAPGQPA